MASCVTCDVCGKVMKYVPDEKEGKRHVVKMNVISFYRENVVGMYKPKEISNSMTLEKDLCQDCCSKLTDMVTTFLGGDGFSAG